MAEGSMRYLCGEVTHSDGNTSRQYVRYDTDSGRAGIEIIFKFTGSIHWIRTLIEFSEFSNLYVAHSDYMAGDKLLCSASANIYASYINKDQYVELLSYNGAPEYKNTMRSLVKNSVLLSIDSSNRLLSQIGMTVADMGFTKFY